MTSLKVFILAFLACSSVVNSRNEDDATEEYKHSIKQISRLFERWLGKYENNVKNLFGSLTEVIHEGHMKASEKLTKGLHTAMKNIENSQAQSDCIVKYKSDVIAVYKKTQERQTACVEEACIENENRKISMLSGLQSMREETANIVVDILGRIDKVSKVENGIKLHAFFTTIMGKIYEVDQTYSLIEIAPPEMIECPETATYTFNAEVKIINENFVACNNA